MVSSLLGFAVDDVTRNAISGGGISEAAVSGASTSISLVNGVANEVANTATTVGTEIGSKSALFFGLDFGGINGTTLAIVGAAVAVGASGIASAVGAGLVGVAGAKATAENPKNFSTALLFQALPQTQGIYGFLVAILILLGAGVIGGGNEITFAQGLGAVGAGIAVGIAAVSAIGQGVAASSGLGSVAEDKKMFGKGILFSVLPETQALYGFLIAILILVGTGLFGQTIAGVTNVTGFAAVAAGLAIGIAGISAIGQGMAAASGISAVLEKSKIFGRAILFAVLPETQALYGFIIAVLILIGFGVLGVPNPNLGLPAAIIAIAAGIAVGLSAVSAVGQGMAASACVKAIAQKSKSFGRAIIFAVLPETQALYGFLIAILLLVGGGILGVPRTGLNTGTAVVALGAGLAVGFAAISAIGQGMAASSGIEAVAHNSKMFGRSILFSVLPETQALYGFLVAILLLVGGGILGATQTGVTLALGYVAIGAGIATGIAGVSAIGQGMAASSGISAVNQNSKMFGKSILFSVLPETQALYGFLIAVLLLVGGGLLGGQVSNFGTPVGLIAIGAGFAAGIAAISAIGQGLAASSGTTAVTQDSKMFGKSILFSVLPETQALYGFLIAILLLVGGGLLGTLQTGLTQGVGLVGLGSGLAVGLAAISAVGQGMAASGGIGAVLEKSKMFGRSILFSVLPETQALYGFLIAVLLLVGGGILGAAQVGLTTPLGLIAIGASLAVGLAGVSAIGQGMSANAGIGAIVDKPEMFGKSIIFSIIPETQALMGFLISILLLIGSGLMGGLNLAAGMASGYVAIGAGLAVGLAAISAFGQGFVITNSIAAAAKDSKMFGKALLFSVLPQTQALYGFLIAIFLLVAGGLVGAFNPAFTLPAGLVAIGCGLAVGIGAVSAIGQGIAAGAGVSAVSEDNKTFGRSILFSVIPETQALNCFLIAILLLVTGGLLGTIAPGLNVSVGLVAIGASISVGLAAISAIGQGIAAASGVGGFVQDSKMFGKALLFSVLPQTQAMYGIIISILLLAGVGLFGVVRQDLTLLQGLGGLGSGLAIGLAAISAVGQGLVAASSIGASVRDKNATGKSLVLSVIPETYAIFGLLVSILMLLGVGIL